MGNGVDDCISRQAALDAMCELMRHWFGGDPKDEIREIKRELEKLPSAQPERRYTVRELSVFRHGISLSLCSKKSAQRWHYDEDMAIEIEFLEHLYEKVGENMRGCKDGTD